MNTSTSLKVISKSSIRLRGGAIFFEQTGLLDVEHCAELDDADAIYEELVRYEHEHNLDPFDVEICLQQMEWGRTHHPRKTLFVLTARKR